MKKISAHFVMMALSCTMLTSNASALSRNEIIKCQNLNVQAEILANVQAVDDVANGLLARSGDIRLDKKMVEIGLKSKSCEEYIAGLNSFLMQVRDDLIRLDKTLTLEK